MDKKISELTTACAIDGDDVSVLVHNDTDYHYTFTTLLTFLGSNLPFGAAFGFGTAIPQNNAGKNGDVFLNTATGSFAQKIAGTWVVVYTLPSSAGQADGTVLYGLGAPLSSTGKNGDTYIDTATGTFYKKTAANWSLVFTMLNGPAGAKGDGGVNGTNGTNGNTMLNGTASPSNTTDGVNGDFYLKTSTFELFGPKTGGVWGTAVSLFGPTGPKGDDGAAFNMTAYIEAAPLCDDDAAAVTAGLNPYALYKTSTGALRYKLPNLPVTDADVTAYLAAAGIIEGNNYTEKLIPGSMIRSAVTTLIAGIKTAGLYAKLRYLWLFNGATEAANCLDFKLTKSLTLHSTGGHSNPVFTSQGIVFDGGNYADTGVKPSDFTDRKISIGAYVSNFEDPAPNGIMGIFTAAGEGFLGGLSGDRAFGGPFGGANFATAAGLSTINVLSDILCTVYRAGEKIISTATGPQNDAPLLDMTIWAGALNYDGAPLSGEQASINRVLFVADSLTDDENVTLSNLLNDYCLTLRSGITRKFTFLGDSITSGTGANSPLTRWTTQICNNKKFTEFNYGQSGSLTGQWADTYVNQYVHTYTADDEGILIALGTNDCNFNVPTADVTANMITIINGITAKGWPLDKIYVNLAYYDIEGGSISKKNTYIAAIQAACDDRGVTHALNLQAVMVANGQDALVSSDMVHPNQAGHDVIANTWINYLP